jgi:hypothetical protein
VRKKNDDDHAEVQTIVLEKGNSPLLRLHAFALTSYDRICYLELDVVPCPESYGKYFSERADDKGEPVPNTEKFKSQLLKIFSADFHTPAGLISKSDFAIDSNGPIADALLVEMLGDWGCKINGGVLVFEPSEDLWNWARQIMSTRCPRDHGGKGGYDVLAMVMALKHLGWHALPAMFNAVAPRLLASTHHQGRADAWWGWGTSSFFPIFMHLVGSAQHQEFFAVVDSFLITRIKKAFSLWQDVEHDHEKRKGWFRNQAGVCDQRDQRNMQAGEVGFFVGYGSKRLVPKFTYYFRDDWARHCPFAKLVTCYHESCARINLLHRTCGLGDPALMDILEQAFPSVVKWFQDKDTGRRTFSAAVTSIHDSQGNELLRKGPHGSAIGCATICSQFQQGACRPEEFTIHKIGGKDWPGCHRGVHVCMCENCHRVGIIDHKYTRNVCEGRQRQRLR